MTVQPEDFVTISLPKTALTDIAQLPYELIERMHSLLEQNTEGQLGPTMKAELDVLVHLTQLSQIVAMALQAPSRL